MKTQDQELHHEHVVVATGVNRIPIEPEWSGQDKFKGKIIHSRAYKNPLPFLEKRVLVVGMGNTGAEIALDLVEHDIDTFISVRGPVNIVPLKVMGNPTQKTAQMLAKFPDWFADSVAVLMRRLTIGNLKKHGIETPGLAPSAQLRIEGKTPVIDLGTTRRIKRGDIRVVPEIDRFESTYVVMSDGARVYLDAVILCTGYRSRLTDFIPGVESQLDKYGNPANPIGQDAFRGLYFLGFDNFKPGGILGAIHRDSETILEDLKSS